MDTGKNHLFASIACQRFYFLYDLFFSAAAYTTSRIGNDAVAAELITAILYFQIGSGVFHRFFQRQFLILFCVIDIDQRFLHGTAFIMFQNTDQIFFAVISDNNVDCRVFFQLSSCCLHITSGCHHDRMRIHFLCFVQHLSGLAVCHIRHRTGVDHINIRPRCKRHNLIPCFFQKLLHRLRLICIYLASQIVECRFAFFHILSNSFLLSLTVSSEMGMINVYKNTYYRRFYDNENCTDFFKFD